MSSADGSGAARSGGHTTHQPRSEVRDGMHIDWDEPIAMDDGLVLGYANLAEPTIEEGIRRLGEVLEEL